MYLLFRLTHFQKMCAEIFVSMATFSPTFCLGPEAISSLARRATQKDAGRRSCGGPSPHCHGRWPGNMFRLCEVECSGKLVPLQEFIYSSVMRLS